MTIRDSIDADIKANRVVLFMKGNKLMPMCGFSAQVVHVLTEYGVEFESRNVLENDELRQGIKEFSEWPTIPQLYVGGEFIGGCDIVLQLHESGELAKVFEHVES
jgi:monothiol glutaredoxin